MGLACRRQVGQGKFMVCSEKDVLQFLALVHLKLLVSVSSS